VLVDSVRAFAADTGSGARPSSFVPHPQSHNHVSGAPSQPVIVGHRKSSHLTLAPKKRSSSPKQQ
jgi:hypothetical protein